METIEERAEKYYQSLARPLADEKGLVITAYCVGAETERLLKHSVMQAEASAGADGAAVGNSAAGQSGSGGVNGGQIRDLDIYQDLIEP